MPMRPSAEYDSGDVQMVAQMSRPRLDFNARLSKLRFDCERKKGRAFRSREFLKMRDPAKSSSDVGKAKTGFGVFHGSR